MTYNPKYNEQNYKYRSKKYKRVGVDFEKEYYENVLAPAVDASGVSMSAYIKQAVFEKMEREEKAPE